MGTKPTEEKEKPVIKDYGKDWPQILAILIACLAPLSNGLVFSWSSPSIVQLVKDKENYDISLDEASYLTVIPPIGVLFTCIIFSKLNDTIGRKRTLWLSSIIHIISWILIAVAKSIYVFYISRFISGIADAILFASLPIYVGEVSTPTVRGTWGNSMTFSIYFGQFLINVIGSNFSIPETAYICVVIPIVFGIAFPFMPESPYFYIMKGRIEDARKSLQFLRRKEDVEEELVMLKSDVERQMSESGTWKDVFTIDSNRKALFAGIFLRASQQFGGISVFAVYTQLIFEQSGGDLSASVSAMIFTSLLCILNFAAAFTLDKLGRKKSYMYSLMLCGIVLFLEGTYFFLKEFSLVDNLSQFNWIPLVGMIAYCVFYSFGLGIVPTLMLGELFSTSIKGKGLCILNIIFAILVSLITKVFHLMTTQIGLYSPFLLFSVCCFVSTILSLYFVPETKGKTLEEIQMSLKNDKKTKEKINNC